MEPIKGIHHVTAIASDPQRNIDFYVEVLGQRLVKTTVNFDDPGTYHLYYGDEVGTPGTVLTFFPWPGATPGQVGSGEVGATAYTVLPDAVDHWRHRLADHGVEVTEESRFGETVLAFADPDGMRVELIATPDAPEPRTWKAGPIPSESTLRGFWGFTIRAGDPDRTARLLTDTMGLRLAGEEAGRLRFRGAPEVIGHHVDVLAVPGEGRGRQGAGSVHHVAFQAVDDEHQVRARSGLVEQGFEVTPVIDRQYFHSIYFREPSSTLFEIATVAPGFTIDEAVTDLGRGLRLPPRLESERSRIVRLLPPIRNPEYVDA